jgi:hypothetical protein
MFRDTREVRGTFAKTTLFCLVLLWVALGAGLVAAAPEPVGRVDWLQGSVTVEREGVTGPATVGDPVYLHDKWQTTNESGAELVFVDESRIRMGPKAFLEITEYVYQPQDKSRNSLISMMAGKARFVVQDLQDYKEKRFRVQTQTAVVGTRGTEFIVVIDPLTGSTKVLSIVNEIIFAPLGAPQKYVVLAPNTTSEVKPNVLPTAPAVAPPAVYNEMIKGVEQTLPPAPPQPHTGGSAKTQEASEETPSAAPEETTDVSRKAPVDTTPKTTAQATPGTVDELVEKLTEVVVPPVADGVGPTPTGDAGQQVSAGRAPVAVQPSQTLQAPPPPVLLSTTEASASRDSSAPKTTAQPTPGTADELVKNLTEVVLQASADGIGQKPTEAEVQKLTESVVQKLTEAVVQKLTQDMVQASADGTGPEPTEAVVQKLTEAVMQKMTEAVAQKLTEVMVQELTEVVVQASADGVGPKPTEAEVQKLTEAVVQKMTEVMVQKMTEVVGQPPPDAVGQRTTAVKVQALTEAVVQELTEDVVQESSDGFGQRSTMDAGQQALAERANAAVQPSPALQGPPPPVSLTTTEVSGSWDTTASETGR